MPWVARLWVCARTTSTLPLSVPSRRWVRAGMASCGITRLAEMARFATRSPTAFWPRNGHMYGGISSCAWHDTTAAEWCATLDVGAPVLHRQAILSVQPLQIGEATIMTRPLLSLAAILLV